MPSFVDTTGIALDYQTLVLPKNSLPAGMQDTFQLEAWASQSVNNIGMTFVTVTTHYPELRCQTSGGDQHKSSRDLLVLDASASHDPSGLALQLDWSCTQDGVDCRQTTGALIQAEAQAAFGIAHVAANTLVADTVYTWTATVRDVSTGNVTRVKSCRESYTMAAVAVLDVELAVPVNNNYDEQQFVSGITEGQPFNFVANVNHKLQLSCSTVIDSAGDVQFTWEESGSKLNRADLAEVLDSQVRDQTMLGGVGIT